METYLLEVEQYLRNEEKSAKHLFPSFTAKKLVNVALDVRIEEKLLDFNIGLLTVIQNL